jgi:AraC-like DNA-binding protein
MDRLSPLFSRFTLSAELFFSGVLCGAANFDNDKGIGILHVLRRGRVRVVGQGGGVQSFDLSQPSLLFYRETCPHRFEVDDTSGADLVCSHIDFGAGMGVQILRGLPDFLVLPLTDLAGAGPVLQLLFDEAFAERSGRAAAVNRLVELFAILLLRHVVDAKLIHAGVLAGLADVRIAKSLMAMHVEPERDWTLEALAGEASLSRARFAARFRETVGTTALDYLTDWRMSVAQTLLKRGKHPKTVAPAVGYSSDAAFARIFARRVGVSPSAWLSQHTAR